MTRRSWFNKAALIIIAGLLVVFSGAYVIRQTYYNALEPVSTSQKNVVVTVPAGATEGEIADDLKDKQLIKEAWAFEWYVRNAGLNGELKAGTYALNPNLGVGEIAKILAQGEVAIDLVTILPGRRIDQIEADLINSGFAPEDVRNALKASNYADHPALVDKPANASLEGYLYPESFQKTAATRPEDIVASSLDQMHKRLTPAYRQAVAKKGLSVHEAIILASIIEQEVGGSSSDASKVSQVFLKRLKDGIKLESDVTVFYGAIADGKAPSLNYDSRYNTFKYKGLPKGPISNVTQGSLRAVIKPAKTSYLFFVAGDDGNTYFARTLEEHNQNIDRYCRKLCSN